MSAAIVEHDNRAPLDAEFAARLVDSMAEGSAMPSIGIAGDANAWTHRPSGQLWRRAGERESNAPGTGYDLGYWLERGPYARDPYSTASVQGVASGIIRAGERVR